jgi:hypothetical protein
MASLDFPSNPTNGQTYAFNGVTYYYNATVGGWLTQISAVNITTSSNTQVLFNDGGLANGSPGLVFDKSANTLTVNNLFVAGSNVASIINSALQNTSGISFNGNFYVPNGNIGIGTNSPSAKLGINTTSATAPVAIVVQDATTYSTGLNVYKRGTTGNSSNSITAGTEIGYHGYYGWDGSTYGRGAYSIVTAAENFLTGTHGSNYSIATTSIGANDATERMRIDANGNFVLGTYSITPAVKFTVNDPTDDYGANTARMLLRGGTGGSSAYNGIRFSMRDHTTGWGCDIQAIDDTSLYGGALRFRTGTGSATATPTERMRIDSAGRVTMPYQPVFYAYRTTGWSTIPGVVICDNTLVNVGGYYSTSTGRFTVPVAGTYLFTLYTLGYTTVNTANDNYLRKNGSSITGLWLRTYTGASGGSVTSMSGYITLAVNDYVDFYVNNGPTLYSDSNAWIRFGGHLIG